MENREVIIQEIKDRWSSKNLIELVDEPAKIAAEYPCIEEMFKSHKYPAVFFEIPLQIRISYGFYRVMRVLIDFGAYKS